MKNRLKDRTILITGGASFIASHMIEGILKKDPSKLVLVDNFSSGKRENISRWEKDSRVEFVEGDLRNKKFAIETIRGSDIVFHLAAVHGGRGFIGYRDAYCIDNFLIDRNVVDASLEGGVKDFFFASSACIYPMSLQMDSKKVVPLKEEDSNKIEPDGVYGSAKLMCEVLLRRASEEGKKMRVVIGRLFTVYGERALENHAIMALLAKSFVKQDPFEIWGDGTQVRNWTYVKDTVDGILQVFEKAGKFEIVNIGSEEQTNIVDAAEMVFSHMNFKPEKILYLKDKPVGPIVRVADIEKVKSLYGWSPKYSFDQGIEITSSWYKKVKKSELVEDNIENLLVD